ncbi:hypothetical protein DMN91_009845, partial [Ooceraea biroi]
MMMQKTICVKQLEQKVLLVLLSLLK